MNNFENNLEKVDPIATIMGMLNDMEKTGSVDSERNAIQDILTRLQASKITAWEAINEAQVLLQGRQDYH